MRNKHIEALPPGFYLVRNTLAFFFEKDATGIIYQLIPETGERDGILEADGWDHNDFLPVSKVWAPARG